nr:hypothetical protein [Tanacetum cinerariifolium]
MFLLLVIYSCCQLYVSTAKANKEKLIMSSNITAATFKQLMLFDYKFVLLGLEYMVNAAITIMLLMLLEKDVIELVLLEYILNAIQALVDKKKVIITETSVRGDLHLEDVEGTECLPTATIFEQLTLIGQVEGMLKHKEIYVTPSHTKKIFVNMKRQGKDFSGKITPLFKTMMVQPQEDIGKDSEIPSDSHHTPTITQPSTSSQPQQKHKSKKSKKKITEVPQLSDSSQDMADEHVTTTSNDPLLSGFGGQEDASTQGRMIVDLDAEEKVALVDETQERNDQDMFDTSILDDEEVVVEKEVSTADPVPTASEVVTTVGVEVSTAAITSQISMDEITLAKALIYIKTSKPKTKGIVIQEPSETPTPTPIHSSQQPSKAKDKGKPKMIKPEKPLKRKDHIMIDEEDNTQAIMDTDYEIAARLQEEEIGELTIEEKSMLFVELMDKRKKHFARLRAEKINSKPPTKTQKRNQMCTYLKNMANYKHNQLKNKSFKKIQMLFNNTMKWIESFVPMDTKLVKGSEKAAEGSEKAKEGSSKKARATLISSKSLTIVEYKIYKEGRKSFIKIIKADGGRLMKAMYLNEVFGYIPLIKTKLLIKKLKDSESEHQVLGRIVGIKRLHDDIRVTAAQKLRPLRDEDWKYANVYAVRDEIKDLSEKR